MKPTHRHKESGDTVQAIQWNPDDEGDLDLFYEWAVATGFLDYDLTRDQTLVFLGPVTLTERGAKARVLLARIGDWLISPYLEPHRVMAHDQFTEQYEALQ